MAQSKALSKRTSKKKIKDQLIQITNQFVQLLQISLFNQQNRLMFEQLLMMFLITNLRVNQMEGLTFCPVLFILCSFIDYM